MVIDRHCVDSHRRRSDTGKLASRRLAAKTCWRGDLLAAHVFEPRWISLGMNHRLATVSSPQQRSRGLRDTCTTSRPHTTDTTPPGPLIESAHFSMPMVVLQATLPSLEVTVDESWQRLRRDRRGRRFAVWPPCEARVRGLSVALVEDRRSVENAPSSGCNPKQNTASPDRVFNLAKAVPVVREAISGEGLDVAAVFAKRDEIIEHLSNQDRTASLRQARCSSV